MLARLQGLHEILFGAAGRERFPPIADIRKLLQDALALLTDQVGIPSWFGLLAHLSEG